MTLQVSLWQSAGRAIIRDTRTGTQYTYQHDGTITEAGTTNLVAFMRGFVPVFQFAWDEDAPFTALLAELRERRVQWQRNLPLC